MPYEIQTLLVKASDVSKFCVGRKTGQAHWD